MKRFAAALTASLLACCTHLASAQGAEEDAHPGAAVYEEFCAACHNQPDIARAPSLAALKELTADTLTLALTEGVMSEQAKPLGRRQFGMLIDYLARKESEDDRWLAGWMCSAEQQTINLASAPSFARFGVDYESTRHLTAAQAGLTSSDLGNLELAWAIGFPDTSSLRAAPAIVGDTMFYSPTPTGRVLAIDINEPCVKWVYEAGIDLRSSITFGPVGPHQQDGLVFADQRGQVHAVSAADGKLIWKAEGRHSEGAAITGAPVLHEGRIIVPVSGSGVGRGANPRYECCVEHGAVVALDAANGKNLWTYHTMPEATYTGKTNRLGVRLRGPSGAPIWSTPTIDVKRGLVYATTGQNTSLPATKTSDAVIAIDITDGSERWVFQALANDVWILSCRDDPARSGPNCPSPEDSVLKDFDFGAAAILRKTEAGRDILLAGQKSGDVWALDPDTGTLLWNQKFGQGTPLGGIHWGMAANATRLFAPINDPSRPGPGYSPEPGMNALDITTGKVLWRKAVTADCSEGRQKRFEGCDSRFGLSAAPLSIDNSIVAGALDGRLYIFDADTGDVIFQYDTLRDFTTVNGYPGKGGSIESHSIFAGSGMLFVGSGYGNFRQAPGNVLLAFKPKASQKHE